MRQAEDGGAMFLRNVDGRLFQKMQVLNMTCLGTLHLPQYRPVLEHAHKSPLVQGRQWLSPNVTVFIMNSVSTVSQLVCM
jgi:hypothetical protein